ncbi:ABC transporter permease [Rhodococcus sp. RS1C4]|uniref:ABC transporter permease n=1 Tax=Nocardiaceae TaxID=85025 RepID=UPI000363A9B2|nr:MULTISPECIES: ABC transporter permease [Rhodococcus]OZC56135.1 ABC transporter permease [Rhodococcus sp. RS1C4]OZC60189.1 ABC transporter permease [Rhodococcus sp. 06-621-2]OZC78543.1 ABC transporter permease [Rhodococcus sp. 06-418-1B]OZD10840.1 ABC transporter permease [Rhodococcus sp. 06-156-4C]OZD11499.1 ABC transporter permease [Rhodococcus sp. 06-156-3C]
MSSALDEQEEVTTPPKGRNPFLDKYDRFVYGAIGLVGFLVVWWAVVDFGYVSDLYLSKPLDVFSAFVDGLVDGTLTSEIWPSVQRALVGFAFALVGGIALGILVGSVKIFQKLTEPVLLFFRNLSLLALLPVFVVFLGIGEESKIAIVFWACFWPIFITAVGAVSSVERILLNAARTLGAGRVYIFTQVVLPAAIPGIFPGIRLAAANAFTALVAAELVGGAQGIGIYINNAALRYQTPQMYAGILTLGLIGILVNAVMTGVEWKVTGWQRGLTSR